MLLCIGFKSTFMCQIMNIYLILFRQFLHQYSKSRILFEVFYLCI